jgi:hypothetical protein
MKYIKEGFGIALSELLTFCFKIVGCLYCYVLPSALASVFPLIVGAILYLQDINFVEHIAFKIAFSLSQILALSISMLLVPSEEQIPADDPCAWVTPSKDLIVAICILANIYIWKM